MAAGKIVQIIGAVVDVEFPQDAVPQVYSALEVKNGDARLVAWCVPSPWVLLMA